ncbi:MAG TPA: carbamate kinase [Firmicutes bacterium]|nr:carbamate kinase [Bacillota bacterium]
MVIALGGNSIIPVDKQGTIEEQYELTRATMAHVGRLIKEGHLIAITHGNGPVVGNIFIRNEMAKHIIPPMPLDICGADSEGGIGYMIQQTLQNQLRQMGIDKDVFTIITQVVVDENDPAFQNPTKPIGPFYSREDAEKVSKEKGWVIIEDSGRGYRRVVPSPKPLEIVEWRAIEKAIDSGAIVIAVGGGGVPVIRDKDGNLKGVEAVIDKDRASSVLARQLGAEVLVILTQVEKVAINFGKPDQKDLDVLTVEEAKRYLAQGEFPPGSMGPKIESAIESLENGGEEVLITLPELLYEAVQGRRCTRIVK